jgi:hypothetical protein
MSPENAVSRFRTVCARYNAKAEAGATCNLATGSFQDIAFHLGNYLWVNRTDDSEYGLGFNINEGIITYGKNFAHRLNPGRAEQIQI